MVRTEGGTASEPPAAARSSLMTRAGRSPAAKRRSASARRAGQE